MITLTRPIIFFDIETSGIEKVKDRIIQIAALKIFPDGRQEQKCKLLNPEMPISPEATKVNGITDQMVANEPTFKRIAKGLLQFFDGCDVAGYNIQNFDIPILVEEFLRAEMDPKPLYEAKVIDVMSLYYKLNPRKLEDAYRHYMQEELLNAHEALSDTNAAISVFEKMLEFDKDKKIEDKSMGDTMESVLKFIDRKNFLDFAGTIYRDESGDLIFGIGKNKGKKVLENKGMLDWMIKNDFSMDTKNWCQKILSGDVK